MGHTSSALPSLLTQDGTQHHLCPRPSMLHGMAPGHLWYQYFSSVAQTGSGSNYGGGGAPPPRPSSCSCSANTPVERCCHGGRQRWERMACLQRPGSPRGRAAGKHTHPLLFGASWPLPDITTMACCPYRPARLGDGLGLGGTQARCVACISDRGLLSLSLLAKGSPSLNQDLVNAGTLTTGLYEASQKNEVFCESCL